VSRSIETDFSTIFGGTLPGIRVVVTVVV